jgi:hypothetical protein
MRSECHHGSSSNIAMRQHPIAWPAIALFLAGLVTSEHATPAGDLTGSAFPPRQGGANNPALKRGVNFTVAEVDNLAATYAGALVREAAHPEAARAWLAFITSTSQ